LPLTSVQISVQLDRGYDLSEDVLCL
jgi:hypothetical protein